MLRRFSIRFRLTAWYSLSLALVLALLAVASYFAMRASMYRAVDVEAIIIGGALEGED